MAAYPPVYFDVPPSAGGPGRIYPYEHQNADNWCWDACVRMVLTYYNIPVESQCQIANRFLRQTECCNASMPAACDQGYDPTGITNIYNAYGVVATYAAATLDEPTLQAELDANRPVEVMYCWTGGGAHVALVFGYYTDDTGAPLYQVSDPWFGQKDRAFSDISSAYGLGTNCGNWTGISRGAP